MKREEVMEMMVFLRNDVGFRKMIREIMLEGTPKRTNALTGLVEVSTVPPGMMTRAEAADILGVKRATVRSLIGQGRLEGHGIYLQRDEFVRYALNRSAAVRQRLVAWLEHHGEPMPAPKGARVLSVVPKVDRLAEAEREGQMSLCM